MTNKFGTYLYNNLPSIYRQRDIETNYTLKRYLDALGEQLTLMEDEIKQLLYLLDVENMDAKYLPFYASMFGVTYNYDVPEEFQRKYLANLVEIQKRKGTKEAIEFTARELTGMKADIREGHIFGFRTWSKNDHDEKLGHYILPKTFKSLSDDTFRYVGGSQTDRFTIVVFLSNDKEESSTVDLRHHQIVRDYVKDLVQPYINLVFKISGIKDSETMENTTSILSDDETVRTQIKETEMCIIKTQEGICYDIIKLNEGSEVKRNLITDLYFDKNTFNDGDETHQVTIVGVDSTRPTLTHNDTVETDITDTFKQRMDFKSVDTITPRVQEDEKSNMSGGDFEDRISVAITKEVSRLTLNDKHSQTVTKKVTETSDNLSVEESTQETVKVKSKVSFTYNHKINLNNTDNVDIVTSEITEDEEINKITWLSSETQELDIEQEFIEGELPPIEEEPTPLNKSKKTRRKK